MPKIHLFSNGPSKLTTRVVPLRFSRAQAADNSIEKGRPSVDDREPALGPTVGATADPSAVAPIRVKVKRCALSDDAPLLVFPSSQLDVENGDRYRAPKQKSFEIEITPKPSIKAEHEGEIEVRWLSANDPVLGKLAVRCYPPISIALVFFLVSVAPPSGSYADAVPPEATEADVAEWVRVINAVFEPAGIVFTHTVEQLTVRSNRAAGAVAAGVEMVLMFREGQRVLQETSPDARPIMMFILDSFKSTVQGMGVSPEMAAACYVATSYGELRNGISLMESDGVIPSGSAQRYQRMADNIESPMIPVWGSQEKERQEAIRLFNEEMARYGVLYDRDGKIVDGFAPDGATMMLVLRYYIPGVVMAASTVGSSGKLLASDVMHWGRALAHELGHFFTLYHPSDPSYLGEVKLDDAWSRGRLMYFGGRFPANKGAESPPAADGSASPPPQFDPMDVGFGQSEPAILLTHHHIHGTTLEPEGGEIEKLRAKASAWAGGQGG